MRRPKPHIEGEIQGDLPHPNCSGLCRRRDLLARGLEIGAGSQNAAEGASKPLKRGTQPPLGINVERVRWFQKTGALTSCSTQRQVFEAPVVHIAL